MAVELRSTPHTVLLDAAARIAGGVDLHIAFALVAEAARAVGGADVAVVRVLDQTDGSLVARAIDPPTSSAAAELAGTRVDGAQIEDGEVAPATARAAARAGATATLAVAARGGTRLVGSIELLRASAEFAPAERAATELAAAQLAFALHDGDGPRDARGEGGTQLLELGGDALAASGDALRTGHQVARIAAEATGARGAVLWRARSERRVDLAAVHGVAETALDRQAATALAALSTWRPVEIERGAGLPDGAVHVATVQLGQPPFGVLQLFYGEDEEPAADVLAALGAFATRAAHAVRAGERGHDLEVELDRTRALLSIVGEAISRLSLSHTLDTAVERIAELLGIDQVGVYLRESGGLRPAAGRNLLAGHADVAGRLDELSLGPFRARAAIAVRAGDDDPAFAPTLGALSAAGSDAVVAVPLRARDEPVGLLVAYPSSDVSPSDLTLLSSLAAQLAVAVQNAQLHERATELGEEREAALTSERQAARRLGALYEISRSFAQSLSFDTTIAAVTSTVVEMLGIDAAVTRVPGERGDQFVPRAVHVADVRLADAVRTILERPQARAPRTAEAMLLDPESALQLGGAHALLVPFLEKGSTAAIVPIASANEVLAQLTILSLDPAAPITEETLATAVTIAQQAALAIDNARLYSQQKEFSETIQRALLPREQPEIAGLELGAVYESAAGVDVGGDVYDYIELADGRLAVVLGDVTGHGIEATADMAMAKFVFRSLAREHSEPGEFLAYANDVVVGEIAVGKFITMVYLTIDAERGEIVCAAGGHPPPRLVLPDGTVRSLDVGGLALGIDAPQTYEELRAEFPPGAAVVLYTDGVIESRVDRDLYGVERLDAALAEARELPAQAIADAVLELTRAFSDGELGDDVAIVVIKRTG